MKPLISIIMPYYNTEGEYFSATISPFLDKRDTRIELIIVDDGSTKANADFVASSIRKSANTIQLIHQDNQGQNAARNTGLSHASGLYIQFLDSDDILNWGEEERLLSLIEKLEAKPDIIRFLSFMDESDYLSTSSKDTLASPVRIKDILIKTGPLWSQLYLRSFLLSMNEPLVTGIKLQENIACAVPILSKAKYILQTNIKPIQYINRSSSITHAGDATLCLDPLHAIEYMRDHIREDEFRDEIEWIVISTLQYQGIRKIISWDGPNSPYIKIYENYINKNFPNWRNNKYLKKKISNMPLQGKLLIQGHYKIFYLLREVKHILKHLKFSNN